MSALRRNVPAADPDLARRNGRPGYYVIATESDCAVRGPYESWQQAVRVTAAVNRDRRKNGIRGKPFEVRVVGAGEAAS